jgi:hypothetical protein
MIRIKNVVVYLDKEEVRDMPVRADTRGAYTTTAMFLGGPNPWGLHQDFLFSKSISNIKASKRIEDAALLAEEGEDILLSEHDHSLLLLAMVAPSPSAEKPLPPCLARKILPIFDCIEGATNK